MSCNLDFKTVENSWQDKLSSIFENTTIPLEEGPSDDFRLLSTELRQAHKKYTRLWWNINTLEQYIKQGLCPRGLRVQIFPAWEVCPDFKNTWETTLKKCSVLLMEDLITHDKKLLSETKNHLSELYDKLNTFDDKVTQPFLEKLKTELEIFEKDTLTSKKSKFDRDRRDQQESRVFRWSHKGNRRRVPPGKSSPQGAHSKQEARQFEGSTSDFLSSSSETEEGDTPASLRDLRLRTNQNKSNNPRGPRGRKGTTRGR